jgi:subtilase family serine protease
MGVVLALLPRRERDAGREAAPIRPPDKEPPVNATRLLHLVVLLLVVCVPLPAVAAPTAQFWEEVGGSATPPAGLSGSARGVVPEHRNVSVALGADGRPVVVYTDWDDVVVRRWTGVAWEEIGRFGSGHLPQLAIDRTGRLVLAWQQFVPPMESWEVYLAVLDPGSTEWRELGGSASGGGVSGPNGPTHEGMFALALGPDGTPFVAYDTVPTTGADLSLEASGLAADQTQIYVRRWSGPSAGWTFVGSGHEGGGASNVLSFRFTHADTGAEDVAFHGASAPGLAIGPDGAPVVAFLYTSGFVVSHPEVFNGLNDDVYVTRWNGTAWVAVGPEVPAGPTPAGLGAAGGASATGGWSRVVWENYINKPVVAVGTDGRPVVAWGESTPEALMRVYLRRFNGTAWEGLGGDGVMDTAPLANDVSLAVHGTDPVLTWGRGDGATSSVFVTRWTGSAWTEVGAGSASGLGISGSTTPAFVPAITLAATGAPTVIWIEAASTLDGGQAYLRTFEPRALADLEVTALGAPPTAHQRQVISVSSTVRNAGLAPSRPVTLRFHLAAGPVPGPGSLLLGSRSVGALKVGALSTATTALTIPAAAAPGAWRIVAVVDEPNASPERNDTNNVRASSDLVVTPYRPDLALTALTVPGTVAAGRPLAITHTVRNHGPAPAGPFAIRFYLSADDTLDATDVLLGTRTLGGLGARAASPTVRSFTVPAGTSVPGDYRVIAVADALEQQIELDETNNSAVSGGLTVVPYRPELAVTALTVARAAAAGRPLAIANTVRNTGPAPAGAFALRFYLSSDDVLDAADVLLGTRTLGGLAAGASSATTSTFTLPAATAVPASYRVIAVVDALEQQTELQESNNAAVSAEVAVRAYRPDLTISALGLPAAGQAGRPLAITHTVRNVGPAPAGAFSVRFYLSADDVLDAGDVVLGARALGSLAAGAARSTVSTFTLPVTAAVPASYRVIAVADALAQQAELDETDNQAVSAPLPVTAYRPDLTITALGVPATAQPGRALTISHTVRNAGPVGSGAFALRFHLSSDEALDAGDVLLGTRPVTNLGAGSSWATTTTLTLGAGLDGPGVYRVIAVVDALDRLVELDEANNRAVSAPLTLGGTGP